MSRVAVAFAGLACVCTVGCRSRAPEKSTSVDAGAATAAASPRASVADAGVQPPNALRIPEAEVMAVVDPMHLPAYAGPTGTVEGTVLVRGPDSPDVPGLDVSACPAALDTYGKLFRAGPRRPDGTRPLADAIVVVTGYAGYFIPEKSEARRVTIGGNCGYKTRTIDMTFGQRLEIANDSTVAFAPYIDDPSQLSVLIAPPLQRGDPAKIFPPRADAYRLLDRLQKFVSGEVFVLRQPLHAVSDTAGHFRVEGVPVGHLTVAARLGAIDDQASAPVDVHAGATEHVDLVLTYTPAKHAKADAGSGH